MVHMMRGLMPSWLQGRSQVKRKAGEIYGAVVTQARHPVFYATMGIPDTPAGRYEAVVLHLFLVLEALRKAGAGAAGLSQALIEAFAADMEDTTRQLGSSDTAAPRKVRRALAGFYERSALLRAAFDEPGRLEEVVGQLLLGREGTCEEARALARYTRKAQRQLGEGPGAAPLAWSPSFPAPGMRIED
jgi:cytochrome b pre-mRNA-processing protein 3